MSKKDDEQYGKNSAAAASVNKSSKASGGFSSFSTSNKAQQTGFDTNKSASGGGSTVVSTRSVSPANSGISQSGFSSLASKSTNTNNMFGASDSDSSSSQNANSVTPLSMPENASFSPTLLQAPSGNLFKTKMAETAGALGITPIELATIISFETAGTLDPMQVGPTTKWGTHRGVIQFGEPQAKQYGADFSSKEAAINSQFGANGAIVKFATAHGYKKGMGMDQLYSAINAGGINKFNASDTKAGGTRGTVRDKLNNQMADHKKKAERLLRDDAPDLWGEPVQVATNDAGLPTNNAPIPASPDFAGVSELQTAYAPETGKSAGNLAIEEALNVPLSRKDEVAQKLAAAKNEIDEFTNPIDGVESKADRGAGFAALLPTQNKVEIVYANQSAKRNLDLSPKLDAVLSKSISSVSDKIGKKITVVVGSGGQYSKAQLKSGDFKGQRPKKASVRHDHGGAGDLQFKVDGRMLDMRNTSDRAIMSDIIEESVANGATGVGGSLSYMGPNTLHIGFGKPAAWGAKGGTTPSWISSAWERGRSRFDPNVQLAVNVPTPAGMGEPIVQTAANEQPSINSVGYTAADVPNQTAANSTPVQTPTQRVDKYIGSPNAVETAPQNKELTQGQKLAAGVIDTASTFIPMAGPIIGAANGFASLAGKKTLGQRIVGNAGNIKGSPASGFGVGAGDSSTDYAAEAEARRLKLLAEEKARLAASTSQIQQVDRYLTANNDTWRPKPNERFGSNANNYR
jgi:hypothetical protein